MRYYYNISCSVDNDEYFELMMTNAWKLGNQPASQKAWSSDYSGDKKTAGKSCPSQQSQQRGNRGQQQKTSPFGGSDEPTNYSTSNNKVQGKQSSSGTGKETKGGNADSAMEKFRAKLQQRGARGIMGLKRSFMICDDDNSKSIDVNEFMKICKDYRIGLEDNEIKALFKMFDADGSGSVDYEEFLRSAIGEMNQMRKNLIKKVFAKLDKNGNGAIEIDDIKGVYNGSKHPDVKSGKKTEDEILGEFLDTFEYHFSISNQGKSKDRSITLDEFQEYYNNISMSIDDDRYFEQMINTCWNLDNSQKSYQKGWKGEA